ncbi:short-chain dehydrogenase [Rhodopseudomonas sp. AAP120]|uniref:SDR family NAD(P)-dependent oxidoreductase n=1 Tax=Rhodopseudomonas sp. AAP120 TaxID=1523430 RepID=UPI0006B8A80B|nr:SDR family NAD(P)-dependent oxidoreductase [Rhodopseudomonas sp. AAP120]KPF88678.1 short-chain dehydrogenase [Rhodopseudomonas sp. AAP120]
MPQKRIWFVTGASRGFGRLWSEAALARGDKVAATARNIDDLADVLATYGDNVLAQTVDVTDRSAVFNAVAVAHRHFGRIDVVVSGAGYGYMGAVEELDIDAVRANFETNVFGSLSVIQAVLPVLRQQGSGHILTVSSIGGILSFPTGGAYTATKFAVEAFSEALAGEVAGFGIKVTIIEPGSFATGFGASAITGPSIDAYDVVRQAVRAGFKPADQGDPSATAAAILNVVDAEEPPLRLVLGATTIPRFRDAYEQRIKTWEQWEDVSIAAHGTR